MFQRLPAILRNVNRNPITSYSKAPCYAIRAGRNLPDKEFRYLRTVIVTAAVYRGLSSQLRLAANHSP